LHRLHNVIQKSGWLIGALVLALGPTPASAQPEQVKAIAVKIIRKAGVRANVSVRDPVDPDVRKGMSVGLSVGLAPGDRNGWRYPISLTTFSENLLSPNGASFAVMRSIGLAGGVGYAHHFGRLVTGASLQTGLAFNRSRIEGDVAQAFDAPPDTVAVDVGHALFLRPHVKAEYFFTRKLALRVSADYVMMRPRIVVTTPGGRLTDRWDASNAHASVGVSFYPFRP
jgi:hypothetical protein